MPTRALLVSNSTCPGEQPLEHCQQDILDFLGAHPTPVERVLFVPYASGTLDDYAATFRACFERMGLAMDSLHEAEDKRAAVQAAQALWVGGGNTFRLLTRLYELDVVELIRERVRAGELAYMGASAGSNVATRSIHTSNDMTILLPPTLDAIQLVPFAINPHYLDPVEGSRHMGETRAVRIAEFHQEHDTPVLGIREGSSLRVEGGAMTLLGRCPARLFVKGLGPREFAVGADLSFLLEEDFGVVAAAVGGMPEAA